MVKFGEFFISELFLFGKFFSTLQTQNLQVSIRVPASGEKTVLDAFVRAEKVIPEYSSVFRHFLKDSPLMSIVSFFQLL